MLTLLFWLHKSCTGFYTKEQTQWKLQRLFLLRLENWVISNGRSIGFELAPGTTKHCIRPSHLVWEWSNHQTLSYEKEIFIFLNMMWWEEGDSCVNMNCFLDLLQKQNTAPASLVSLHWTMKLLQLHQLMLDKRQLDKRKELRKHLETLFAFILLLVWNTKISFRPLLQSFWFTGSVPKLGWNRAKKYW